MYEDMFDHSPPTRILGKDDDKTQWNHEFRISMQLSYIRDYLKTVSTEVIVSQQSF